MLSKHLHKNLHSDCKNFHAHNQRNPKENEFSLFFAFSTTLSTVGNVVIFEKRKKKRKNFIKPFQFAVNFS